MTEPAPAEGDDGPATRPVAPIPLPPDPLAPWLGAPPPADPGPPDDPGAGGAAVR